MKSPTIVQVAQQGQITISKAVRDMYQIREGDQMTLLDLGGVFLFSPRLS